MAVGIIDKMGGITTVTLVVVVITGILTSVLAPVFLKLLKNSNDPVAIGLSLGGTGHAIGTGTALKIWSCRRCNGWSRHWCDWNRICYY